MAHPTSLAASTNLRDEYSDLTSLFFMRIACRTTVHDNSPRLLRFENAFRQIIGPLRDKGYKEQDIVQLMEMHLEDIEAIAPMYEGPLFNNLTLLADKLSLSVIERQVLAFRVLTRTCAPLEEALQGLGSLSESMLSSVLAVGLGRDRREIASVLDPNSPLMNSGLLEVNQMLQPFLEKLALTPGLANALLQHHSSLESLVSFAAAKSEPPTLDIDDYPHLIEDVNLIIRYLQVVVTSKTSGVNMLVYGPPGVGKTELVRVLAKQAGFALYDVAMSGPNGSGITSTGRHSSYRFNQCFFSNEGNTIILFDEADDMFRGMPSFTLFDGIQQKHGKAWINRLLEQNTVPTLWVANSIDFIDPAILRRFDYILEMRNPPQSIRRKILESSLSGFCLPSGWLERQAREEKLTPAFADRAAKVLRTVGISEPVDVARHFERIVRNQLEARRENISVRYPVPTNYRLDFVNASVDLNKVCGTLSNQKRGQLLLYGPPGSGKTAFAYHLARTLDRPLIIKRASDILSPWLGETEKNMVRMFRVAASDNAVLLLDEADSFLQDRRGAVRSWEITQVNELLTQMECFEGLFLCATNFRENLDSAAMRRFGLKVSFDYLTAEQAWMMFVAMLAELGVDDLSTFNLPVMKQELAALSNITIGDFAAAKQCLELIGENDIANGLLKTLHDECRLKPEGGRKAIGFA